MEVETRAEVLTIGVEPAEVFEGGGVDDAGALVCGVDGRGPLVEGGVLEDDCSVGVCEGESEVGSLDGVWDGVWDGDGVGVGVSVVSGACDVDSSLVGVSDGVSEVGTPVDARCLLPKCRYSSIPST